MSFPTAGPLVTVVIPHYEQPRLVRAAVQSVVDQDYENLEIVVVDDGSTQPDAVAVLAEVEAHPWDRDLRVIRQENRYLGAARNAGTRAARGDLVAFVDDDDFVDPTYIRTMVDAMTATGADVVTVAVHAIEADDHGDIVDDPEEAVWCFLGDLADLGTMDNVFGGAAALFKKDVLLGVGGFFERHGVGHEDWDVLGSHRPVRRAGRLHPRAAVPLPGPAQEHAAVDARVHEHAACLRQLPHPSARAPADVAGAHPGPAGDDQVAHR